MATLCRISVMVFLCLSVVLGARGSARGACNLVPSTEVTFPSTLGDVSTPFAVSQQIVTIERADAVFAANPAENSISLSFNPPGGPVTTLTGIAALPPSEGSRCRPQACAGTLCRCVSFVFPDTDSDVTAPSDGRPLTGPVTVKVETGATVTALVDSLFVPGTTFRDPFFPSFVALPPHNDFRSLVEAPGADVLAAADDAGNLFIPLGFAEFVPTTVSPTRFVEARVPALAGVNGEILIDTFTADGRRLPPLVRRIAEQDLLGTADAPSSVLRVRQGASLAGLVPEQGRGPIVISGVSGFTDNRRRADAISITVGERFAVYENRECGFFDTQCIDVNGDGDQSDYFLYALDISTPRADPFTIDEFDGRDFAGYPATFPPTSVYAFDASDALVAYRIPEPSAYDVNGNGTSGELIRSGVYDLGRRQLVPLSSGSPRQEIAEDIAAFSVDVNPPNGPDVLLFYDAASVDGHPAFVHDGDHPFFAVTRYPAGTTPFRTHPFDMSVAAGRIAFSVIETVHGEDFTHDGDTSDAALFIADGRNGLATNLAAAAFNGFLRLGNRWLAYEAERPDRYSVGLFELARPGAPPRYICDARFGSGWLVPSFSDSIVPCVMSESRAFPPRDYNGDGDRVDENVLRVFLPDAPRGAIERNLRLALFSQFDPQVAGDTLVVGVDESAQGADLDGDGIIGPPPGASPFGPFVLHAFNAQTQSLVNFGRDVAVSFDPFIHFIDRGVILIGPPPNIVRTIFRDLDRDGHFEEQFLDPKTGSLRLADNCPLVANPGQEDRDRDGLGDACDPSPRRR